MMNFIKKYITKQFIFGIILCFGIFSKYILGPNNLIEEASEFYYFLKTGKDINLSDEPEQPDSHLKQLQDFMMIHGK